MSDNKKSLSELAKTNPTQLGDPVSLKAETSQTSPTDDDRPTKGNSQRDGDGDLSLKERAKKNPTLLGDPVSLKAEKSDTEPTEHDRGARGTSGKSKI